MAAPRSQAQCPGPQPAFSAVVNQQPQLLAACVTVAPGGGCASPDTPVVDSSRTHAQETTLTATVPSGFTATSAHWMLQKWNGTTWENVWVHKSIQGAPLAGGTTVSFGAPGLVENTNHQARVGFCDDKGTPSTSDDYCFCWSEPATFTTTAFEEVGPAPPPSPMLRKVQDRFDRPNTDAKCATPPAPPPVPPPPPLGDGLGPLEVWKDCDPNREMTVRIKDVAAWATPSSHMYYTRQPATSPNSYAQIQLRVDDFDTGTSRYNLELGTRLVPTPTGPGVIEMRGYYLKLVHGPLQCTQPTMMLARLPDEYGEAKCAGGGSPGFPHLLTLPNTACDPNADPTRSNKCDCKPPLYLADGSTGYSQPIWMRVEARDDPNPPSYPRITGAIAWGTCPAGQPMSACQFYCAFDNPRVDDSDDRIYNLAGTWGAFFHEKFYSVKEFDAGSHPAP